MTKSKYQNSWYYNGELNFICHRCLPFDLVTIIISSLGRQHKIRNHYLYLAISDLCPKISKSLLLVCRSKITFQPL